MKMSNREILIHVLRLQHLDFNNQKLKCQIMYIIAKNYNTLYNIAQEIEAEKASILSNYGYWDEDHHYQAYAGKAEEEVKALEEFLDRGQEISICGLPLDMIKDIEVNKDEIDTLLFMIQE